MVVPSSSASGGFDTSDPLFLHPADVPLLHLIPRELKKAENYDVWSKAMKSALGCKSKLGFVNGECPRLINPSSAEQWDKCNALVSWILKCVSQRDIQ